MRITTRIILLVLIVSSIGAELHAAEFSGQVVCSGCWAEADRETVAYGTPADLECALRCAADGIPPALAIKDDDGFELLVLAGEREWMPWIGRFARVDGELGRRADRRALQVDSIVALERTPWPSTRDAVDEGTRTPMKPALAWTDLGGHAVSLDDLEGRVAVVNFWATWCAPCRKEMPDLIRIQNRYGMYGVQVVGVAADAPEHAAEVAAFARRLRVNFPVLLGATSEQMKALGLGVALPATAVIDRHGHVISWIDGVVERAALEATLDRLVDRDLASGRAAPETDAGTLTAHAGHTHRPRPGSGTQASLVPS